MFYACFVRLIKHMLGLLVIAVILHMFFFLLQSSVISPRKISLLKESISFLISLVTLLGTAVPFNAKCNYGLTLVDSIEGTLAAIKLR